MANFEISLTALKSIEGLYVWDADDSGGETYSGISRKNFPQWEGWARIDGMKIRGGFPGILNLDGQLWKMVSDFYKAEFWDHNRLTEVVCQEVADEIFEMAVNLGNVQAVKIVQKALNLLNKAGRLYKNTSVDGVLGQTTVALLNAFREKPKPIIKTMNGLQFQYYVNICTANESQEKFFYSWLTRT